MLDPLKTVATRLTLASKFNLFVRGATTPFRALSLIVDKPGLLGLSLGPIITTLVFFALLLYGLLAGLWSFMHSTYLAAVSNYSGILFVIASILLLTAISFFAITLLTFMMSLLASPFNDILAEKTERALGIKEVPHWSAGRFIRVFFLDIRKSIITVLSAIIFSIGMLIPVANMIFFIGLALLNTFTFITYPQSRREQGLIRSLSWIKSNLPISLGFGMVTLLLFSIPVVGFFMLPISVVGGTLLFCEPMAKQSEI